MAFRRGRRGERRGGEQAPTGDDGRDISQRNWFSDDEIDIARWLAESEVESEREFEMDRPSPPGPGSRWSPVADPGPVELVEAGAEGDAAAEEPTAPEPPPAPVPDPAAGSRPAPPPSAGAAPRATPTPSPTAPERPAPGPPPEAGPRPAPDASAGVRPRPAPAPRAGALPRPAPEPRATPAPRPAPAPGNRPPPGPPSARPAADPPVRPAARPAPAPAPAPRPAPPRAPAASPAATPAPSPVPATTAAPANAAPPVVTPPPPPIPPRTPSPAAAATVPASLFTAVEHPADAPGFHRGFPVEELIADFRTACISRSIDDRQIAMQKQNRVFFQISSAGHEALSLAFARHLRPGYDWFFPYYREQALVLGLGVTPTEVLLQAVGSADDPSSAGRQMPAHWGSRRLNIVTQSSHTGSQCIPAVGCAEAGRYLVRHPDLVDGTGIPPAHGDELTYVSLGEGACSQGEFWESLNTAVNLHLPVLYVVPDNGFAISVPMKDQHPAPIRELVSGYRGLAVHHVDGTDYFAVREAARTIVEHIRAGVGPALVHADVVRPYSHSAADTQSKYRSVEELAEEAKRDPLDRFERDLIDGGVLSPAAARALREEAHAVVLDAAQEALRGRQPDPATVTHQVVALPEVPRPGPDAGTGDPVPLGEAIRRTLHEVMATDQRVRVFGEDVADAPDEVLAGVEGKGGVFGTTHGLQRAFGKARCYNTPLSEANIVGRAVGQGLRGLRPSPEIQFFDYIWPAMTQIRTEAATIRWRSNGAFSSPMVLRAPIGGYLTGGSIWHSQSGESIFAHLPGLLVAMPSRARDAAGLLRYAFKCEDPVLFLEHKHLLRQPYTVDPFPATDWVLPFGVGDIRRPGDDLTVITWGATVEKSVQAARHLAETEGIEVEVIDLRTISPWDHELVAESVARTSRALVVHEDTLMGGFGGEVASWIGEHCFADLDAPVRRVAALDTLVAYHPALERTILPQVDDIAAAMLDLADY